MQTLEASYIAGLLDGDGSIHFQFVRQKEYRFGFYIRASVSFSQSTSARAGLEYIRSMLGAGYLRDRGTGMSDLVITSRPVGVTELLKRGEPYVVLKREHVRAGLALLPPSRSNPGWGDLPAIGTPCRCVRFPKLFQEEADICRRC